MKLDPETERLLRMAALEIKQLRRANEVLGAKVEMIDLFAMVLHTKPAYQGGGMSEDIVWAIERKLEGAPEVPEPEVAVPAEP